MKNTITVHPSKELYEKTRDIPKDQITGDTYRQIGSSMLEIMRNTGGVGLSANQVGLPLNMCVIELNSNNPMIMLNPRIIKHSDRMQKSPEGCLSVPGAQLSINRFKRVVVEYEDVTGETQTLEAFDALASVIQHEIDHLRGVLILNRVSNYHKAKAIKQLERYKKYIRKNP